MLLENFAMCCDHFMFFLCDFSDHIQFLQCVFLTGAKEMLRFDTVMSYHCNDVVNAIVTALTVQSPKIRYVVGLDAKVFMLLSFLPSSLTDWLIGLGIYRLKPKH